MSSETTYAGKMGDMRQLVTAVEANSAELPHLQAPMERLDAIHDRAEDLLKQQAALTASKQEISLKLKTVIGDGQRVANALRAMLKEHYGVRSEKLAEFGIQPFRGRVFRTENRGRHKKPAASRIPTPQP
jgi:hypothetical protein